MLKQRKKLIAASIYMADMVVTAISFFMAYIIRDGFYGLYPVEHYYWLVLIIVPVWSFMLVRFQAYRSYRTESFIRELLTVGEAVLLGGLIIGAVGFGLQSYDISRSYIILFIAVNFLLLSSERLAIRAYGSLVRKRGYNCRNVLIVGMNARAIRLAAVIEEQKSWGLNLLGFVTDKRAYGHSITKHHHVIGDIKEIEEVIKKNVVDIVIFAVPRKMFAEMEDIFLMLEDRGINAMVMADFFQHVIAKVRLEEIGGIPFLTFSTTPADVFSLAVKRFFDIAASAILLIFSMPVMAITAIAIKTTSPGPVFFTQKRCGLQGRVFSLYKFRSMILDAEQKKKELEALNEMEGPVFKVRHDPRITKAGRFIRKMSIDELPQLWNVLKGDMSIVGPRPPLPDEVAKYERWQKRRLSMRPGLTCFWQISGRNRIKDFNEWVRLDLKYIDNWSLSLDAKIFFKTIPAVLFRSGAA